MQSSSQELNKGHQINIILALENLRVFVQAALDYHLLKIDNQNLKKKLEDFFKEHSKNMSDNGELTRFLTAEFLSSPSLIDEKITKIIRDIVSFDKNQSDNNKDSVDKELCTEILKALTRLYQRCLSRYVYAEDNSVDHVLQLRPYVEQKIRLFNSTIKEKVDTLLCSIKNQIAENYEFDNYALSNETERHPSCFISYAWPLLPDEKKDETWTQSFLVNMVNDLKLAGINAKIDINNSRWGRNSIDYMNAGIKNDDFIFLIGTNSLYEKHINPGRFGMAVRNEINLIIQRIDRDRKINPKKSCVFPILLTGEIKESFPQDFKGYTVIESIQDNSYLVFLKILLKQLYHPHSNEQIDKNYDELWKDKLPDEILKPLSSEAVREFYLNESKKQKSLTASHNEKSLQLVRSLETANDNNKFFPPAELWNVPLANSNFIGRTSLLEEIKTKLQDHRQSNPVILTCHGLGGVGKTQLVLRHIYENLQKYQFIAWFHADTEEKLFENYLNIAKKIGITITNKSQFELIELVKSHFDQKTDWLFIYDDAASYELIKNYMPRIGGSIIVTTRHYEPSEPGNVEVTLFTVDEAKSFIKKIINKVTDEEASQLSELLGKLPLALAQACMFIKKTGSSVTKYISYFKNMREELWPKETAPKDYEHGTVAITWQISFNHIKQESEFACELLNYCGYLNANDIPKQLLLHITQKSELDVITALGTLNQYSMIELNGASASLHKLVQTVLRDNLNATKQIYLRKIIAAIGRILPTTDTVLHQIINLQNKDLLIDDYQKLSYQHIELIPHLETIVQYIDNSQPTYELFSFYLQLGHALHLSGMLHPSVTYLQKALDYLKFLSKEDHREMILTYILLAQASIACDDFRYTHQLYTQALVIQNKLTDIPDQTTLYLIWNLGKCCIPCGETHQGLQYLENACKLAKQLYGNKTIAVARTLHDLSYSYNLLGYHLISKRYFDEFIKLAKDLKIEKQFDTSPDVTKSVGITKFHTPIERTKFLLEELAKAKKIHGNNHPLVVQLLHSLGAIYLQANIFDKAISILHEAIDAGKIVFGEKHSIYCSLLITLADAYHSRNKLEDALTFYQKALPLCENKSIDYYQKGHLLLSIGQIYLEQENFQKALTFLTQSLTIAEQFSKDHPFVCTIFVALGNCHYELQKYKEALGFYLKALHFNDSFSPDSIHPALIELYYHLGDTYLKIDDNENAYKYLTEGLTLGQQIFADDEIIMAKINYDIACVYINDSKFNEAQNILETLSLKCDDYKKEDNEFALNIIFELGIVFTKIKNKVAALDYCNQALSLANEKTAPLLFADIYFQLAFIHYELNGDLGEGERFTKVALAKYEKLLETYLQSDDKDVLPLLTRVEDCHRNFGKDAYTKETRQYIFNANRKIGNLYLQQPKIDNQPVVSDTKLSPPQKDSKNKQSMVNILSSHSYRKGQENKKDSNTPLQVKSIYENNDDDDDELLKHVLALSVTDK